MLSSDSKFNISANIRATAVVPTVKALSMVNKNRAAMGAIVGPLLDELRLSMPIVDRHHRDMKEDPILKIHSFHQ